MSSTYRNSKIRVYNGTDYDQYFPQTDYRSVIRHNDALTRDYCLYDDLFPSEYTVTTAVGTKSLNNKYIIPVQWPAWMKKVTVNLELESAWVYDGTSVAEMDMSKIYFYGPVTGLTHFVTGDRVDLEFLYCYDSAHVGKPVVLTFRVWET